MGCNSRRPYWEFPDLVQQRLLTFTPIVSFIGQRTKEDCLVDLKLGGLGDLNNFVARLKSPSESAMNSSSSSGSYKRARAATNAMQVPSCLVDGCVADLSICREYHRRHKVCEAHSKTSRVTIEGHEKRFCQQCSRFHSLAEFDDGKRSCRKRLDGHNRRRRKPQADSSSLYSSKYIPNHQGSKFVSYGSQAYATSAVATSAWDDAFKAQKNHFTPSSQLNFTEKSNNFQICFSHGYREKQFPFLQSDAGSSVHLSQPHPTTIGAVGSTSSNNSSSNKMLFSDGFDRVTVSDRASSLLSSSSSLTETRVFNSTHSVQHPSHSPVPSTRYNGLTMEDAPAMYSVLAPENGSNSNASCPDIGQNGSGICHQKISFSWR